MALWGSLNFPFGKCMCKQMNQHSHVTNQHVVKIMFFFVYFTDFARRKMKNFPLSLSFTSRYHTKNQKIFIEKKEKNVLKAFSAFIFPLYFQFFAFYLIDVICFENVYNVSSRFVYLLLFINIRVYKKDSLFN
mgnify:CR=1 FL=1